MSYLDALATVGGTSLFGCWVGWSAFKISLLVEAGTHSENLAGFVFGVYILAHIFALIACLV